MNRYKNIITILSLPTMMSSTIRAGVQVNALDKDFKPDPRRVVIMQRKHDGAGNTSVRNVNGAGGLKWREYGYYERSRDLGQVFTPTNDFRLDAIILRTGNTEKAVLPGAPGAPVFIQFFEVTGEPRINSCGTPEGTPAKHGFTRNHRAT